MNSYRQLRAILARAGVRPIHLITATTLSALTLSAALGLTVLSGWLITRAWEMPPVLDLSIAITGVRALGTSRAAFRYSDRLYAHRLALRAQTTLRCIAFDAGGDISDTDVERITDSIVRSLVPFYTAGLISVLAIGGIALLQPLAAVILASAFLVTGIVCPVLASRATRVVNATADLDALDASLRRLMLHRAEYSVAGQLERLESRVEDCSQSTAASQQRNQALTSTARMLSTLAQGLSIFGITVVGISFYSGEPTWLGMLVLIPLASFEAHAGLDKAAIHLREAMRSATKLHEAMRREAEQPTTPAVIDISATDALCQYGEQRWTLSAPFNSRLIIRGPSGLGKSTLLRTLAGELPTREGVVQASSLAQFHSEDEWIFATTVRENLLLAKPDANDAQILAVLEAVGFTLPLDTLLEDGAGSLSSGQRRRLLLARALLSDAPILLLDEPTEHIATADAHALLTLLKQPNLPGTLPHRTIIAVTHLEEDAPEVSRETSCDSE